MNAFSVTGQAGELRWGYRPAATLASWSIAPNPSGGELLTATIAKSDPFRVSQSPLTFEVSHPAGKWRWGITSLQITGATLTASLSP